MKIPALCFFIAAGLPLPAAADTITIVLDSPSPGGLPEDVLAFSGTLTNTTSVDVYLNGDDYNLTSLPASAFDDSPFFNNTPTGLIPALGTTGDIGLFNVTIPGTFSPGNYNGSFTILGGANPDSQDIVGTVNFTVNVLESASTSVPEPATGTFLVFGLAALAASAWPKKEASK